MIVSEQDALSRLGSPLNLMNRMKDSASNPSKRREAMGLFGVNRNQNQSPEPTPKVDVTVDVSKHQEKPTEEAKVTFTPFVKRAITALAPLPNHPSNLPNYDRNPHSSSSAVVVDDSSESKEPGLDDLVGNADTQVKLGLAHDKALDTLVSAVDLMKMKLDDIKPDKLPGVISATSKVVDQIQRQRLDQSKNKNNRDVHFHFYTPTQKKIEDYTVVEVG